MSAHHAPRTGGRRTVENILLPPDAVWDELLRARRELTRWRALAQETTEDLQAITDRLQAQLDDTDPWIEVHTDPYTTVYIFNE